MDKVINILVLIVNYGTKQREYCSRLIESFNTMQGDYSFTVKVFSSESCGFSNCDEIVINKFTGTNFILNVYDYIRDSRTLDQYDYILLTENDLLFSKENFDTFFKHRKSDDYTIGFLLYEEKGQVKYLISHGNGKDKLSFSSGVGIAEYSSDRSLFRLSNCHSALWFFKPAEIVRFIYNPTTPVGHRTMEGPIGWYNIPDLESNVSKFFYSETFPGSTNGIKKFIPISDFEKLLVHHQINKYVHIFNDLPSVNDLIKERDLIA